MSFKYELRPIRFLEILEDGPWRMKLYGIAYRRALPRPELIVAAKAEASKRLALVPQEQPNYKIGFIGVHDGRTANFVFVDWWADENELHHHVYVSPTDQPEQFSYVTPTGLTACVWDLRVLCFERQAWLDTVLNNPSGPDTNAYLNLRLNEDV